MGRIFKNNIMGMKGCWVEANECTFNANWNNSILMCVRVCFFFFSAKLPVKKRSFFFCRGPGLLLVQAELLPMPEGAAIKNHM